MKHYQATISRNPTQPARAPACEAPGCSLRCPNNYSCHEQRMGEVNIIVWPAVALVLFVVLAGIVGQVL